MVFFPNMNRKILALSFVLLFLAGCSGSGSITPVPGDKSDVQPKVSEESSDELPEGTLHRTEEGYEGDIFVRGYAEKTMMEEPFCNQDCEQVEYVFFNIVDQNNEVLDEFIEQAAGNAYIDEGKIGLGCLEEQMLVTRAFEVEGERGNAEYTLDEETTEQILTSTEEGPVVLKLEKTKEVGSAAPACYSHFTNYEIVKL